MKNFNDIDESYEEENFDYCLSGTQAKQVVQKLKHNPAKYGKVDLYVRTAVYHYGRAEVGNSGSFEDDTYKDSYYQVSAGGAIKLSWKSFLEICKDADEFSALKQKCFEENGVANNTEEHGTGINVRYRTNEYGFTSVHIG